MEYEGCLHLIIDHHGVRPFPHLSPTAHGVYDLLLENSFRKISGKELAQRLHYASVRNAVCELRALLEKEGLGTVHCQRGIGYSLRQEE